MKQFTHEQVKAARAKVKTGADFPREIQEFKEMGILSYEFRVDRGVCTYFGQDGYSLETDSAYKTFPYATLTVSSQSSAEKLRAAISIHQHGKTDFPTFCVQAAIAGVHMWRCDLTEMVCIYLDHANNELVREPIPHFK